MIKPNVFPSSWMSIRDFFSCLSTTLTVLVLAVGASAAAASPPVTYNEHALVCAMSAGIDGHTRFADLARIDEQTRALHAGLSRRPAVGANNAYDFHVPLLNRFLSWMFSESEFNDVFALHNPFAQVDYDLNIWTELSRLQVAAASGTSGGLIAQPDLLTQLRAAARLKKETAAGQVVVGPSTLYEQLDSSLGLMASKLIDGLLKTPPGSVSQEELFRRALAIAGDTYGALGLIASVLYVDSFGTPRAQNAVVTLHIQPLFDLGPMAEQAGNLYHFWGYLARATGDPASRYKMWALSRGYEAMSRADRREHEADSLGVSLARLVDLAQSDVTYCK